MRHAQSTCERKKVDKGHIAVFVALNRDFFGGAWRQNKSVVAPAVVEVK
jgi:hypothetical protein